MQDLPNYGEYTNAGQNAEDALAPLHALCNEAAKAEQEVLRCEAALKKANAHVRAIVQDALPKAMRNAGVSTFTTDDGRTVKVEGKLQCSVPKAKQDAAYEWLREHELGDIIKNTVTVHFGSGEEDAAKEAMKKIQTDLNRTAIAASSVHAQTLKAAIKRQLENKVEVPKELFGIYEYEEATIKQPKKSKKENDL